MKLENSGSDTGWQFDGQYLKYATNTVLNINDKKVIINQAHDDGTIEFKLNSNSLKFDSNGKLTVPGNLEAEKCNCTATSAEYADLAEYYEADKRYSYGTVLVFGGDKEITLAKNAQNEFGSVIGVVSKDPGFILNKINPDKMAGKKYTLIALKGRTPVKLERKTTIKKGDKLYLSFTEPGKAGTRQNEHFLGIALKDSYNEDEVEMFVK